MFLLEKAVVVPLVTPFDQKGDVDFDTLASLVEWHIECGTDALLCFGTTGEGAALHETEKESILAFVIEKAAKKIPVIANTGTNSTIESIRLTQMAKRLGADACLAVVPYYVMPEEKGIIAHFEAISKVGLPSILYHHPGRTGITLTYETISLILSLESMVGLKDCSSDFKLISKVASDFKNIMVFSGIDSNIVRDLKCGARGSISPFANLFPKEWKAIVQGDESLFIACESLLDALYADVNPQGIKCGLSMMGKIENYLRLPLSPSENESLIRKCLSSFSERAFKKGKSSTSPSMILR